MEAPHMPTTLIIEAIKNFGPLLALIVFFIWRDYRREDKLAQRIESLEQYQRETLVDLLRKTTIALTHNAECLKWIGRIIERVCGKCPRWEGVPDQPELPKE
jgi:hypothetical protein